MKPNNVKASHWRKYNALFFTEHILGEKWYRALFGKTEKKLFQSIHDYAAQNNQPDDFKILDYKKGEYSDPVVHAHYPIVFRGAASEWPCTKNWSFEYFANKFGDQDVQLFYNTGMVKGVTKEPDQLKFRDFIAKLKTGAKDYLKFSRILDEQSDLRKELDYTWLKKFRAPGAKNNLNYFFMGSKGTHTPLHADYAQTIYVEVAGIKKWTFYPTNQRIFIGTRSRRYNYFYTDADPADLNNADFPLLKYATPHEVLLYPGDVLYFPSLVWHQVENVTDTIAVASKFATFKAGFVSSKMLFTCFLLATRPWLIKTIIPWSKDIMGYKKKSKILSASM